MKLFPARCLPSLFHQSRFDWERESLSAFDSGSRRRCHLSVAAPSPNFFHRSHFDWEPERFSVAAFGYRQAISQAELSATPSFARCSPSLFHQSHFDWERESLSAFDSGSRRLCHLSVAAPSPNFFHRSHFDWQQSLPTPKRGFAWTCSSRISVVAGFFDSKEISHYKVPTVTTDPIVLSGPLSRTCPTTAPVWRLGCSCLVFAASN